MFSFDPSTFTFNQSEMTPEEVRDAILALYPEYEVQIIEPGTLAPTVFHLARIRLWLGQDGRVAHITTG
jgi:hypothetical protein